MEPYFDSSIGVTLPSAFALQVEKVKGIGALDNFFFTQLKRARICGKEGHGQGQHVQHAVRTITALVTSKP